jgi:ABC-type enterochelin transport system substrate-binding protein
MRNFKKTLLVTACLVIVSMSLIVACSKNNSGPTKQNSASASVNSDATSGTYTTTDGKNKIAFAVNYVNAAHTLWQWMWL